MIKEECYYFSISKFGFKLIYKHMVHSYKHMVNSHKHMNHSHKLSLHFQLPEHLIWMFGFRRFSLKIQFQNVLKLNIL